MVTKTDVSDVNIDWEEIERLTEVPRTYLMRDKQGREFFKMYTPSQAEAAYFSNGWEGKIVSTLDRSLNRKNYG